MDVGLATVLVVVFGALAVRAVVRLVKGRPLYRGLGVAALVLWLALTGVAGWFEIRHHHVQATATTVVREISGNPDAQVACVRLAADVLDVSFTAGRVGWDRPDVAVLRYRTCAHLWSYLLSPKHQPSLDQVTAVHVLTHEAVHVRGERNEAVTECVAMTLDAQAAELLGAAPQRAQRLADLYAQVVYPSMPDGYRMDCSQLDVA